MKSTAGQVVKGQAVTGQAVTRHDGVNLRGRDAAELLESLVSLRTPAEARRFIRDLMTDDEIRMVVARWRVARMLAGGKTYKVIEKETGLSSRTIARISRWLQAGDGGYRLLLQRRKK